MSFIADKQTLEDLNILGKYKPNSIFSLFNKVNTGGGERLLEQFFMHPLTDPVEINKRSEIFKYFQNKAFAFPFHREQFDVMENYLGGDDDKHILSTGITNIKKMVLGFSVKDEEYNLLQTGIQATINVINTCFEFFEKLNEDSSKNPYSQQIEFIRQLSRDKRISQLNLEADVKQMPFIKINKHDHLLRQTLRKELLVLTNMINHLDVYITVGNMAAERGFHYADALPHGGNLINIEELCHPALAKAVGNAVSFHQQSNMIFLTGANMAGKSTFMKAFGVAVYLAHMGFPVAAKAMSFSVKDGIYSSINVADNLNMGYSHFYAEVLRVKRVAEEVSSSKDMIVIFDELFKGTNVKDAYDATLAVTEAFSAYRNCFFIISTHIIEVGKALQEKCNNIQFCYLPTVMEGTLPRYTYQLKMGITTDRQGMIIIENEGIIDMLSHESFTDTQKVN